MQMYHLSLAKLRRMSAMRSKGMVLALFLRGGLNTALANTPGDLLMHIMKPSALAAIRFLRGMSKLRFSNENSWFNGVSAKVSEYDNCANLRGVRVKQ